MAHPDVFEAAVIAVPDAQLVRAAAGASSCAKPGATPSPADLVDFLAGAVARWWLPDQWTFIDEIPKTSVGKFDKKVMRAAFADGDYKVQTTPPAQVSGRSLGVTSAGEIASAGEVASVPRMTSVEW